MINVERMRRASARAGQAADALNRRRWLASLTPEHRARHERLDPFGGWCGECVVAAFDQMSASMARVIEQGTERQSRLAALRDQVTARAGMSA